MACSLPRFLFDASRQSLAPQASYTEVETQLTSLSERHPSSASSISSPLKEPTDRSRCLYLFPLSVWLLTAYMFRFDHGGSQNQLMQASQAHEVGRYHVTPMTKLTETGQYSASVSIRRGMHDRVFRLIPLFSSAAQAAHYALAQGRQFVLHNQLA